MERGDVVSGRPAVTTVRPTIRVIVADDEPLARQALRRFLLTIPNLTIVAEADDIPSLHLALGAHAADLLFLDIEMPGGSGLALAAVLPASIAVVFTTAYAEHAAAAFALDAVDYLLKPFGADRVREAVARWQRRRTTSGPGTAQHPHTLLVRFGARLHPVAITSVWRIEGADDFVRVVTGERAWLHGVTMSAIERQLDPARFVRVHRSHIVNLAHVTRVERVDGRRLAVVFPDGSTVACSRAGSSAMRALARHVAR